jgi:hypothetical protein
LTSGEAAPYRPAADAVRAVRSDPQRILREEAKDGTLYIAEISRITKMTGIEDKLDSPPAMEVVYDILPRDVPHGWKYPPRISRRAGARQSRARPATAATATRRSRARRHSPGSPATSRSSSSTGTVAARIP